MRKIKHILSIGLVVLLLLGTLMVTVAAEGTTQNEGETAEKEITATSVIIYSSIALAIMVAGGVAIYMITKHQSNNQQY